MAVGDCFLVSLALTSSILLVTGLFLPGWSEDALSTPSRGVVVNYRGLWEECDYRAGVLQLIDTFDFLRAVEVLTSLGLFLLVVGCITFATYECTLSDQRRKRIRYVMATAALAAAVFTGLGVGVFAGSVRTQLGPGVGLSILSALCAFVSAVLAFCAK